jgi:ferritin
MISKKLEQAINEQIAKEIYSSNLYLSMAGYFSSISLAGMASWMRAQSTEELQHAYKLFDFLLDRGGLPVIGKIDSPPNHWKSPLDGFQVALDHEKIISKSINDLARLARKEDDLSLEVLLHWFITEQVEEEATVSELVDRLKLASDSPGGLFILDNELRNTPLAQ